MTADRYATNVELYHCHEPDGLISPSSIAYKNGSSKEQTVGLTWKSGKYLQ